LAQKMRRLTNARFLCELTRGLPGVGNGIRQRLRWQRMPHRHVAVAVACTSSTRVKPHWRSQRVADMDAVAHEASLDNEPLAHRRPTGQPLSDIAGIQCCSCFRSSSRGIRLTTAKVSAKAVGAHASSGGAGAGDGVSPSNTVLWQPHLHLIQEQLAYERQPATTLQEVSIALAKRPTAQHRRTGWQPGQNS